MSKLTVPTVILIEDDPETARALKALLERSFKETIIHLPDLPKSREYIKRLLAPPHLILCDKQLPGGDGLRFLVDEIKASYPETHTFLVTGDVPADGDKPEIEGIPIITKPIDITHLRKRLSPYLTPVPPPAAKKMLELEPPKALAVEMKPLRKTPQTPTPQSKPALEAEPALEPPQTPAPLNLKRTLTKRPLRVLIMDDDPHPKHPMNWVLKTMMQDGNQYRFTVKTRFDETWKEIAENNGKFDRVDILFVRIQDPKLAAKFATDVKNQFPNVRIIIIPPIEITAASPKELTDIIASPPSPTDRKLAKIIAVAVPVDEALLLPQNVPLDQNSTTHSYTKTTISSKEITSDRRPSSRFSPNSSSERTGR